MIVRDLFRCSTQDLHTVIVGSDQTVARRGVVGPASALGERDIDYLVSHPDFDPSLSFVAYDAGEPVAFLVSRIEGEAAVWSLFGGSSEHGLEVVLEDALDRWRAEGARTARQGATGLLASAPRLEEDAALVGVLKARGFAVGAPQVEMALELKRLPSRSPATERDDALRSKGYRTRPARPDEVVLVARQFHPRHTGLMAREAWNALVRGLTPEALVVCEHRRQLIGFAALLGWTLDGDAPVLGPVFVEPVHRDTGLADVLLRHALVAAKEAGKARARVLCEADATGLYEAAGFALAARYCRHAAAELE
jgi:predicted N-acetyltransferase YhbS